MRLSHQWHVRGRSAFLRWILTGLPIETPFSPSIILGLAYDCGYFLITSAMAMMGEGNSRGGKRKK